MFLNSDFKNMLFFDFERFPKARGGVPPPPPFQILNFKMLQDVCNKQFLTPKTRPIYDVLCTLFLRKRLQHQKKTKNH